MEVLIRRFKQLDSITVSLDNVTLLIGGNNSGKSSILQAIQFGISIAQTTSLIPNAKWKDNKLPTSFSPGEFIYRPIKDVSYLAKDGQLKQDKSKSISIEYICEQNHRTIVFIARGKNKNIAVEIQGEDFGKEIQSIEQPFSILVTGLAGIPNEERYQPPFVVKKAAAQGDSNSVFRNILLLLKQNSEAWQDFQNEMQKFFPNYIINVSFDMDKDEFINCTAISKGDWIKYPIDSCGTGILQVIQIISYIYLFSPKILLLDEPDSHLHPNNQRLLAKRLMELSEIKNTKIVIATHSKYLVGELIDDSKLLWLLDGKLKNCDNNQVVSALMDIGALDFGQRLHSPKWVLLTEDSDLSFLKTLLLANGVKLEEGEIASYKGCTKVDTAKTLLFYLKNNFPNAKFILHRDRDFLDDKKIDEYKNKFTDKDISFLITEFNDIEGFFIGRDHVKESCGLTEEEVKEVFDNAFQKNKDALIKKYTNVWKQNITMKEQSDELGEIAAEFYKLFASYNPKYIHGKEMLKAIRRELSSKGKRDNLNCSTAYLHSDYISSLFLD